MMKYIARKNLDITKYDFCIENSLQSRIYAYSWYLDIVAENWDVLVLDDYKAVMPLPWNSKFKLKYISQPYFCQQLGVFSLNKIPSKTLMTFVKSIPKGFVKKSLQLNSSNIFTHKNIKQKENYILSLKEDYSKIFKQYSKGRKHAVKFAEKLNLEIRNTTPNNIFRITRKYYPDITLRQKEYSKIEKLCSKLEKSVEVFGVFNNEKKLLGGAIFLRDKNRITYLFSSFSDKGKKEQAASHLINFMIKENSNSNLTFDFEGSMIPGIAKFYRSFNANLEPYFQYTSSVLSIIS